MSRRPVRFAPGETLIGCSLCGFTCLYPSEAWYGDDRLFYCNRHVEYHTRRTALTDSTERATFRPDVEEIVKPVGPVPSWREG